MKTPSHDMRERSNAPCARSRLALRLFAFGLATVLAAPVTAKAEKLPDYDASAGMLRTGADPERPDAELFHIAYTLKGADPAKRPVTFAFNGGPGAASIFLHIAAIGPKTLATTGDGGFPAVPARLEENPDSWIRFTDLVFIDTVGTGYSRMLPGPDGKLLDPKPYYNVPGDLDSIARFIKQWLTIHKRWSSPKAIAGESYGGQRVAALSRILAEKYAINLNRAVLISPALYLDLADTRYDLIGPMTLLPTQAAIAAHHGLNKLGKDPAALKSVEDFAATEYLTGLASLGRMSSEQEQAFHTKVGGFIGIDPAQVARHRGRISESVFAASLLAKKGLVLDTYDGTQASDNPTPELEGIGAFARSISVFSGVLLPPFMDYVRNDLGYSVERPYLPLDFAVGAAWDRSSTLGGPEDLVVALAQNTDLKALVVHGYHDLMSNYLSSRYVLDQTVRAKGARERLSFKTYYGGHMFYLRAGSRAEFAADVRNFYESAP